MATARDFERAVSGGGGTCFAFGNCRSFSLACVGIMRAKGIAARCRCGFATYFMAGFYEDHWICEYWDRGWKMLDAQKMMSNVKVGAFINGAMAWQLIRQFGFDANLFGFFGAYDLREFGISYVIKNMIRDAGAVLKNEFNYGYTPKLDARIQNLSAADCELFDNISQMILAEDILGLRKANIADIYC